MGKLVVDYIQEVFLVIIRDYRIQGKNIRLHLQAHSDLLPLLFSFSDQNYVQYLTQDHVKLTNLLSTKPEAFTDLEIFGPGNKFSTIPGELVTKVGIYREVKVRGGPMEDGHSASINAENFILNSHVLAKLKKELKNKMNLKTDSRVCFCNDLQSAKRKSRKEEGFRKKQFW